MKKLKGICVTNEVNLYNEKIPEKALVNNYNHQWGQPIPSFANHNHTKAVGYTVLSGLFIEPHLMYVLNSMFIPENEEDEKAVQSFCYDFLYRERVLKNKKDYDYLKEKLKEHIKGDLVEYYTNGAFIFNKGIVNRVFPALSKHLRDGLIDINLLDPIIPGIYKIDEFVIYAHKYFRRGYSYLNTLNAPFLERIERLKGTQNKVQIAIDLDCIGLASVQVKEYEYSYWGGPKFDDKIENIELGVTCFNNDNYNELMSEVRRTEMGWYIQDEIKTFECEEIIDIPNIKDEQHLYYGCRYVHSMVDKETYSPIHLDGAIRAYDDERMIERLDVRMNKAKRNTNYTKLWRIDGEIEISKWKELISHYYRDNTLIGEYFGGIDENIKIREIKQNDETKEITLKDYVPDNLTPESGIKCFVSYSNSEALTAGYDIQIIPTEAYILDKKYYAVLESINITINKAIEAKSFKIHVPDAKIISYADLVVNLPIYFCNNAMVANEIIGVIKEFVDIWVRKEDDRLLSFSLKIPYEKKTVTISLAGHVNCFYNYFHSPKFKTIPEQEREFSMWLVDFYNALSSTFNKSEDVDPLSFVKENNVISIARKTIDDENGLYTEMLFPKEQLELMQRENIGIAYILTDEKITCSKCGNDYISCNCVLFQDAGVELKLKQFDIIGMFWTNRKEQTRI